MWLEDLVQLWFWYQMSHSASLEPHITWGNNPCPVCIASTELLWGSNERELMETIRNYIKVKKDL